MEVKKLTAQELRIGNYIFEPNNENTKPFKIWSIYEELHNEKINGYPIGYFKPIELTEEWLLKIPKELQIKIPKWIKHIHTLQNWYYYENKCQKELVFK